jgi:hypothetical protein
MNPIGRGPPFGVNLVDAATYVDGPNAMYSKRMTIAAIAMLSKMTRGIERCIFQRLPSRVVLSAR